MSPRQSSGFTIIEVLLTVAIMAILSAISVGSYLSTHRRTLLDSTSQEMTVYLRFAQQKALSQEEGQDWGIHFENPSSGAGFYALFFGNPYNSGNVRERIYLPGGIKYLVPSPGLTIDVIFERLSGTPNGSQSIEITFVGEGAGTTNKKTISINAAGAISIQ